MDRLGAELDLTSSQEAEVERRVIETERRLHQFKKMHQKEVDSIIQRSIEEVNTILSPKQRQKLNDLYESTKRHWYVPDP